MDNLIALVVATAVLVAIPGPNVALIVATSIGRGTTFGLLAVAGTTLGVAAQLVLTVFGLTALVQMTALSIEWLRWIGVAYLVYLAVVAWRAPADELGDAKAPALSGRAIFWGGAAVAVVNPKTLLFNSAFLPQFVDVHMNLPVETQLPLLAVMFLTVLALGDCVWAVAAGRARGTLARFGRARNRLTSVFLLTASAALAFSRR